MIEDETLKVENHLDRGNYLSIQYPDTFVEGGSKIKNLGEKFAAINSFFLEYLKGYHIPAAYIKPQDKNSLLFIQHYKFPFYVKIANIVDKRTGRIFIKKEGSSLNFPLFELHYGNGKDSIITESHLQVFELCSYDEVRLIYRICSKVNVVLKSFFSRRNFNLAELCCHFGKTEDKVYLIDGFTPNSLKILPVEVTPKTINPYKLNTPGEMRHYTDQIFNLINS